VGKFRYSENSDKQCNKVDYGDGHGESDCYNGNIRKNPVYRKRKLDGLSADIPAVVTLSVSVSSPDARTRPQSENRSVSSSKSHLVQNIGQAILEF
jgi:hypothetical protein